MEIKCGRGLAPDAVCQLQTCWLIHCHRGQAPSHILHSVVSVQRGYSRCSGLTGSPDFTSS
ncbi:hypothetical protein EUX57_18400 [Pseudomonas orientalis]|uniref:Uncharacterized protein n=1 Tax=Pseudomonas orientalis TaxID=76758 RepID=A0A4Q7CVJ4_9PSED|nr:hypothetical protein EUX57_18400 [Pseudomonas orientalis]